VKLAVVGVGGAGCRIVDRILAFERASGRDLCDGNTLLIDSTKAAFEAVEHVPEERQLVVGDVRWDVDSTDIDGDPEAAAEIAREEHNEIVRAFDLVEFHEVDGVLVVAGLAGATGGGAGAVVVDQLRAICDEPVYAVGVLPAESEGQEPALNAARALRSFVERADNVVVFDNGAWGDDVTPGGGGATGEGVADLPNEALERLPDEAIPEEVVPGEAYGGTGDPTGDGRTGDEGEAGEGATDEGTTDERTPNEESPEEALVRHAHANAELAERLVTLFAAGEFDGSSAPENRLDPSDIARTLDTGGVSTIGYASTEVSRDGGLGSWLRALRDWLPWVPDPEPGPGTDGEEATDAAKINRLVRRAARSELTLPCEVSSADRALIALSGPSRVLSRKGFESGRYWLEQEADIVDVMAGDEPHDRSSALTAVVLYSNVTDVPRIDAMQGTALGREGTPGTEEKRFDAARSS
jgi:cell division GTPase FtsZ